MIMSLISVRGHLGTPEGIFSLKNKKAICWTRSGQVHLLEGTFVISTLPFKMSLIGHSGRSKVTRKSIKRKLKVTKIVLPRLRLMPTSIAHPRSAPGTKRRSSCSSHSCLSSTCSAVTLTDPGTSESAAEEDKSPIEEHINKNG